MNLLQLKFGQPLASVALAAGTAWPGLGELRPCCAAT
jgi:hypothetical protein